MGDVDLVVRRCARSPRYARSITSRYSRRNNQYKVRKVQVKYEAIIKHTRRHQQRDRKGPFPRPPQITSIDTSMRMRVPARPTVIHPDQGESVQMPFIAHASTGAAIVGGASGSAAAVCSCPHVTKPSTLTPTSPSKNFFTAPTCSGFRVGVRVGVRVGFRAGVQAGGEARARVGVGV